MCLKKMNINKILFTFFKYFISDGSTKALFVLKIVCYK